ncbi:MAG TPA: multiheme c-type cytochrome, partial [Methylomirabilota bacterium]|nr:multiheme c-type cytochrome [Methylomirabilota bacterium]
MSVEWLWLSLLLPLALWPVVRYARSTALWILVGGLGGATVASAVWWQGRLTQSASARQALTAKVPSQGRPGGYISSDSCQACHPDQYASWHRSYHRTMTQLPTATSVRGNFTHVTLELDGQSYHLERKGDEFWVEMVDPDWSYVQMLKRVAQARGQGPGPENDPHPPRVRKRISLLTGSHHMQAYWVPGEFGNTQYGFPFTYLFEQERWVPRRDVFLLDPATRFAQQVWNVGCISCHATA